MVRHVITYYPQSIPNSQLPMQSIHLLVFIHGMWGNPEHLAEFARIAQETHSTTTDGVKLHVLAAESNREQSTYDGIDWGGERVAEEVRGSYVPFIQVVDLQEAR
jgi:Putative serine esterase (DUF676)